MIYLVSISIASILANGLLGFKYYKNLKEKEELSVKLKTVTDFAEGLSKKLLKEVDEKRAKIKLLKEIEDKKANIPTTIKAVALEVISEEPKTAPAKKRGRRRKPNTNKAI